MISCFKSVLDFILNFGFVFFYLIEASHLPLPLLGELQVCEPGCPSPPPPLKWAGPPPHSTPQRRSPCRVMGAPLVAPHKVLYLRASASFTLSSCTQHRTWL